MSRLLSTLFHPKAMSGLFLQCHLDQSVALHDHGPAEGGVNGPVKERTVFDKGVILAAFAAGIEVVVFADFGQ